MPPRLLCTSVPASSPQVVKAASSTLRPTDSFSRPHTKQHLSTLPTWSSLTLTTTRHPLRIPSPRIRRRLQTTCFLSVLTFPQASELPLLIETIPFCQVKDWYQGSFNYTLETNVLNAVARLRPILKISPTILRSGESPSFIAKLFTAIPDVWAGYCFMVR